MKKLIKKYKVKRELIKRMRNNKYFGGYTIFLTEWNDGTFKMECRYGDVDLNIHRIIFDDDKYQETSLSNVKSVFCVHCLDNQK